MKEAEKARSKWGLTKKELTRAALIAICLLAGTGLLLSQKNTPLQQKEDSTLPAAAPVAVTAADSLEQKLQETLSAVSGAGTVRVAVTYAAGREAVYATESSEEQADSATDTRLSNETTLAVVADSPVLLKEYYPQIAGVLIVSSGAKDPLIAERLYRAAKGLLGITGAQIAVVEGEEE